MMALPLLTLLTSSRYITSKFSGQPNTLLLLVVMACPLCMNSCQYVLEHLIPALYTPLSNTPASSTTPALHGA